MSQTPSVEPSNRSSLNPVLQAALGSLDVQLEEELARYRRQRSGRPVMSPRGFGRHQTRKPLELISVEPAGSPVKPSPDQPPSAPVLSIPLSLGQPSAIASPWEQSDEPLAPTASQSTTSLDVLYSDPDQTAIAKGTPLEEPTPRGDLVTVAAPVPPEDYLESSEQLLRSLTEEEAIKPPQKRFSDRLLTPLGIGSILLLLLSTATLAYLLTRPAVLTALGLDRFFGIKAPTTTAANPTNENPQGTPILEGPDLAADEFVDLNLNNLSRLETSPSSESSPSPVPSLPEFPGPETTTAVPVLPSIAPPRPSAVSPVLQPTLPPKPAILSAPPPQATRPEPPPVPAATRQLDSLPSPGEVATSPLPTLDEYYYVLINYSSDRDLEQARTLVPDAYVRDFPQGTQVQMGAFKAESEAQALVTQLQQQGISASIYRP